jgi:hypothetical protein
LSEKEEVAIRAQMATADTAYINNGVITPEEVTKSRFGGEQYSFDTKLSDQRDEEGFLPVPEPDLNAPLDANGQPGLDLDGEAADAQPGATGVPGTPDGAPEEKQDAWTEEARKKSAEARKNGTYGKTWEELSPEQRALHMKVSKVGTQKMTFEQRAKLHEELGGHLAKLAKAKTDVEKQQHARNAAVAAIKNHGKAPDKKAVAHVSSRLVSSGGGKSNLMSIVKKYYNEVEKETNPND